MASVDPSELLSHASWLRQLAGSLVHEGADDLVQDTWVAALRRPPRDVRGARAWLRAVVTNAARLRWRGDANRRARENATAEILDHEAPSPAELLERHELQQLLARLVTELDEPFRSTVLLRFAEGLTPTQIARRLSIPAGTVRWRLKEALARLRAKLDALHRGDRRTWMLVLAPLAMPRHTAPAPIPLALLVLLGAAVCVVAIVVVLNRDESRPSSVPQTAPRGSVAPVRAPSSVATAELSWFAQEGVPHRVLQGRVVLADGAPAAGALVRLIAAPLATQEIRTDANGHFDFGEQPPREYALITIRASVGVRRRTGKRVRRSSIGRRCVLINRIGTRSRSASSRAGHLPGTTCRSPSRLPR
jgi:RNA polymerase sigma-70 factor (ECF subfamily)